MKIGFVGDIVGRPGRKLIKEHLKNIKNEFDIDIVVANGENASHGFGLTIKNAQELFDCGIDVITGGNHTWDKKKDILELFKTKNPYTCPHGRPIIITLEKKEIGRKFLRL